MHPPFASTDELAVIYSPRFLEHDPGQHHPENAGRLTAIVSALQGSVWSQQLRWLQPPPLEEQNPIQRVLQHHAAGYVTGLRQLCAQGGGRLDPDTSVSRHSYEVALLAVNGWIAGVDYGLASGHSSLILARPPGHHAIRAGGMGFCLFSNAAIAAYYALEQPGIERVGIVDWDVHHGNGTQSLVEPHPGIAYCSLHQSPAYPGTGKATDQGHHQNVLNVPLPPGSTGADYNRAFEDKVLPFLLPFNPDLLLVSAGYDAAAADPLAAMALQPEDFGQFTKYCLQISPRLLLGLEGGYDYEALGQAVVATVAACLQG